MKRKKCQVTRREELFYYVTSGSNVTRDVHWWITVAYQQIANGNIANQIHGFTIDYGKFILKHSIIHNPNSSLTPELNELCSKKEIIWMNSLTYLARLKKDLGNPNFVKDMRSEYFKAGVIRNPRQNS